MAQMVENWDYFWSLGMTAVKELEFERGILASARNELFGTLFGRDSLITSLNLLNVYQHTKQDEFLNIVRKVLLSLVEEQGKELNVESGEEPGKIIHEYRTEKHEHLTRPGGANGQEKPWYLYPDQILRNYDTVDATPLFLITLYRYQEILAREGKSDPELMTKALPSIKAGINWIFWYGDSNGDGFIDYQLRPERTFGGLTNQNWMDSSEATFHEDGNKVPYPIAPVEAQAYTYAALKMWAKYFAKSTKYHHVTSEDQTASRILIRRGNELKQRFNEQYVLQDSVGPYLASAIDGTGKPLTSIRSSMGHAMWASLSPQEDGELDGIIDLALATEIVKRLLSQDMFVPEAGIRTLSKKSHGFEANSYHNGSIWPHDNAMIADGFEHYGFTDEANLVRIAMLKAVSHFNNPLELYVYEDDYADYLSPGGQRANRTQAWAAAAVLSAVAPSFALVGRE